MLGAGVGCGSFGEGCLQPLFNINVFAYAQVRVGYNWTGVLSPEADFAGLKCVGVRRSVCCRVWGLRGVRVLPVGHVPSSGRGILSTSSQALL